MRAAIGAIAVSLSLLAVPAAHGATEEYLDRGSGVRFIVDGPVLTVRLEPQAENRPPDRVKWCLLEGADGEDAAGATFEPFIRVLADPIRERRMGWALRRYLRSREEAEAWLPEVFSIVVMRGGRTAVATGLRRTARGRSIARRLCGLVRDSGVALGPTAVYGPNDVKLRSC